MNRAHGLERGLRTPEFSVNGSFTRGGLPSPARQTVAPASPVPVSYSSLACTSHGFSCVDSHKRDLVSGNLVLQILLFPKSRRFHHLGLITSTYIFDAGKLEAQNGQLWWPGSLKCSTQTQPPTTLGAVTVNDLAKREYPLQTPRRAACSLSFVSFPLDKALPHSA